MIDMFEIFRKEVLEELKVFTNSLRAKSADEVIDAAYELVVKRDLGYLLTETDEFFTQFSVSDQAKLIASSGILDKFYILWIDKDNSLTTFRNFINGVIAEKALL